jgi:hypothetical protein
MNPADILAMAAICDEFVFGSPELAELHRQASHDCRIRKRDWQGRESTVLGRVYHDDIWYVVVHPGCAAMPTFRTLNHIIFGQHVPATFDVPSPI